MKRLLLIILTLAIVLGGITVSFAASSEANESADTLYDLGLFNGTGTDADGNPIYDLDRAPTRHEAVTMLVRLLGKDAEAKAGNWDIPFTDVASWAKPYVGYAYANGLTSGTSATTYSGNETVTATQYITFILRALGYDSNKDFKWNKAWELSDAIGLTDGEYDGSTSEFLRSDIVIISENALETKLKGSNVLLLGKLYNQKLAASWGQKENSRNISSYGLPAVIGKTTLTYDKAYALLGQDPAVIADAVKTVGDVAFYMNAVNFGGNNHDAFTPWYGSGDNAWGFNPPGYEQLKMNYGSCCAGNVNVALYLLKGDYEEQGVIRWTGGGNHTIAYVKTGGKYYVFDPTNFANKNGGVVTVLDRLEDYYDKLPATEYPKAEMNNLVALTDTDVCYPWGWDGDSYTLTFPTEVKGHVLPIYPADASRVSYADVRIDVPMWNSDKLDVPARNTDYDTYEGLKEKYMKKDVLLEIGSLKLQDGGNFRGPVGTSYRMNLTEDGRSVSFTATSSNTAVCEIKTDINGTTMMVNKAAGECTIYVTYCGHTYEYYYTVF